MTDVLYLLETILACRQTQLVASFLQNVTEVFARCNSYHSSSSCRINDYDMGRRHGGVCGPGGGVCWNRKDTSGR